MRSATTWLMGLVLLAHAMGAAGAQAVPAAAPAPASPGTVVLMELDGAIGPAAVDHVRRGLRLAAREQARLAVIQLDTPGGLDASMRDIVKDILASPVPVATFVAPDGARADTLTLTGRMGLPAYRSKAVAANYDSLVTDSGMTFGAMMLDPRIERVVIEDTNGVRLSLADLRGPADEHDEHDHFDDDHEGHDHD